MAAASDPPREPGVGLAFDERMSGPFALGACDPREGARRGERASHTMTLQATVTVSDISRFVADPARSAAMAGEVDIPGIGPAVPFDGGTFHLFPLSATTLMVYELGIDRDGERYFLVGRKRTGDRPLPHRLWAETTTLHTRLHRGPDGTGEVVGAGMLRIGPADFARMLRSMRTPRAGSPLRTCGAVGAYALLFARELGATYLPWVRGS